MSVDTLRAKRKPVICASQCTHVYRTHHVRYIYVYWEAHTVYLSVSLFFMNIPHREKKWREMQLEVVINCRRVLICCSSVVLKHVFYFFMAGP